jgi:hypothetical protein
MLKMSIAMTRLRHIIYAALCFCMYNPLPAQTEKAPQRVRVIFEDLPVDNAQRLSGFKKNETPGEKISAHIFIKASLSKETCYAGEPLLLSYKLYTRLQSRSEILEPPALEDFVSHKIETINETARYELVKGEKYRVYEALQYQLFPFQNGVLHIPALAVNNKVDYEDPVKGRQAYSGIVTSNDLKVLVKALPAVVDTSGFSGAIGQFSISAGLLHAEGISGENNTLYLFIKGNGNFSQVSAPVVQWPKGCRSYVAEQNDSIDYSVFPACGVKRYAIPFVAADTGSFIIPPVRFTYFDPEKGRYLPVKTDPVVFLVHPPANPLRENNLSTTNRNLPPGSFIVYALLGILLAACITIFILRRMKKIEAARSALQTVNTISSNDSRHAVAAIVNDIKLLTATRETMPVEEYLRAAKHLLLQYLNAYTESSDLTEEALIGKLEYIDASLGQAAAKILRECNHLLFSPSELQADHSKIFSENMLAFVENADRNISLTHAIQQ